MGSAGAGNRVVVGIDVGGTNLQFGVVGADDAIVGRARGKTEADEGRDRVVDNLVRGVEEACAAAGLAVDDVAAVGVASAGAIDTPRGVILESPNLGWKDVPLRDILRGRIGRPVVLDNDVNGAVWGEYHLGAGRDRGDLLGVWVGTGIGGGLVLNGRIYRGGFFTAGEIGHTVLVPDAEPGRRTVEDLCSRTGIRREARRRAAEYPGSALARLAAEPQSRIGTKELDDAFERGDPLANRLINESARLLGIAIANWVTVLSLETVVLGGGITEALGEPYLKLIRGSFEDHVFPRRLRECELLVTELKADSALLGAALLARESIEAEAELTGGAR